MRLMDIKYPDYPCIALRGAVKNTVFAADGTKSVKTDEIMFYPVNGIDDMTHVEHCRKTKGYAVVGHANLDKILERAPYKRKEVEQMKRELGGLVLSPEMRWAKADADKAEKAEAESQSLEARAKRAKGTKLEDLVGTE